MKSPTNSKACIRALRDAEQIRRCKDLMLQQHEAITDSAATFTLCASLVRLSILRLLEEEQELCVCDLAEILDLSVPAVSQHLRKLKQAEAVTSRRSGNTIYHTVKPEFSLQLSQATSLLNTTVTA